MAEKNTGQGHCLCGAVTFKIEGDPIYNVICHCENCKRAGGSVFHTASIFRRQQYTLLTPQADDPTSSFLPNITVYADFATQSGQPLYRRFCSTCGSPLSAMTPTNNEIISIPGGILPRAGHEWTPHKEQFVQDKAKWLPELGDLAQSLKGPTSEAVKDL